MITPRASEHLLLLFIFIGWVLLFPGFAFLGTAGGNWVGVFTRKIPPGRNGDRARGIGTLIQESIEHRDCRPCTCDTGLTQNKATERVWVCMGIERLPIYSLYHDDDLPTHTPSQLLRGAEPAMDSRSTISPRPYTHHRHPPQRKERKRIEKPKSQKTPIPIKRLPDSRAKWYILVDSSSQQPLRLIPYARTQSQESSQT